MFSFVGGVFSFEKGVAGGEPCDWWIYDDLIYPFPKLSAAVGFDELDVTPTTFDEIRPGCWIKSERLLDMDANHMDASVCFPNTLPRFCGQTFYERPDQSSRSWCVKAYNDWIIEDWCAGDGYGPPHPAGHDPAVGSAARGRGDPTQRRPRLLRDHLPREPLSARTAVGARAPTASGTRCSPPARRRTRSSACTSGRRSQMPATSPDAPFIVSSTLTFSNAMGSVVDFIFSGTLERFPELKLAYSEGQVGWMPYVMERADKLCGGAGRRTASARICRTRRRATCTPDLRLHLRRRGRPRQPQRHRHGPDLLRDGLPARRLAPSRTRRRSARTSARRPA